MCLALNQKLEMRGPWVAQAVKLLTLISVQAMHGLRVMRRSPTVGSAPHREAA